MGVGSRDGNLETVAESIGALCSESGYAWSPSEGKEERREERRGGKTKDETALSCTPRKVRAS